MKARGEAGKRRENRPRLLKQNALQRRTRLIAQRLLHARQQGNQAIKISSGFDRQIQGETAQA